MVTASAPSQAFLFGEHAVLYEKPALACSIDRRAIARAEARQAPLVYVESSAFKRPYLIREGREEGPDELKPIAYALKRIAGIQGVYCRIDSSIPIGSGMASSASVAACSILAVTSALGAKLTREELLERVFEVEREIHGRASKTGPACAVPGGVLWVSWRQGAMRVEQLSLREPMPLLIAWSGRKSLTRNMILRVAQLVKRYPEVYTKIIDAIGEVAEEGRKALEKRDFERIGELMTLNHRLLQALKVSTRELDAIVEKAIELGAYGAKLSGGGGGGCCVIAVDESKAEQIAKAIERMGFECFKTGISLDGARIEEESP